MHELFFRNKLDVKNIRMNQTIKQSNKRIFVHIWIVHILFEFMRTNRLNKFNF